MQNDAPITSETRGFICNWIPTGPDEKRKAFYDIWDLVLKNYLPTTRPILFRSCKRKNINGKIASFTGRLECARRFNNGNGSLLICDTGELLEFEAKYNKRGFYKHTFFPLVDVLIKAKNDEGWGFTERFLSDYIGEHEYIMRVNQANVRSFKWA
ncbi:hypothetical protein FKG96_22320 [Olivibacter sp. LS-1]|uniref:hypothetical protein n=1 Tax=Olivibacter sp. LS-1 TaxID=2592345 RepID=UPI0011EB386D|nr:hypothetical protein [Olivibacter sp. LS-1]QEL03448.1 hypothetical protein FKG96_22320 [Olivibacter sp. LS-1]